GLDVRCELRPLPMERTLEFLKALCAALKLKDRVMEDLRKSPLFRDLPGSPIAAILLAKLLNENANEVPSNMTELYSKYLELILGRWDMDKGLQSQKEYQALESLMMSLAVHLIDHQRTFVSLEETREMLRVYLADRNLGLDTGQLLDKLIDRCEII